MQRQIIRLSRKGSICVATAHGLIRLTLGDAKGEFAIELPDDLQAHRTPERALNSSKYVEGSPDRVRPKFRLLEPHTLENGSLVGLVAPQVSQIPTVQFRVLN